MSFFEDYVEDGTCCASCGVFLGEGDGFITYCVSCEPVAAHSSNPRQKGKGKCSVCGKKFGGVLAAQQHMRDAHNAPMKGE